MSSEDSSSEEDTEKLKEATWTFVPAKTNGSQHTHSNGCEKKDMQSRRAVPSKHENDGNELQTTPEFRAHVAKKLGFVLDSCISDIFVAAVGSSSLISSQEKEGEEEDGGFRLFSTSVPGECAPAPVPSLKRRPVPSSSDSDSEFETRIREAAVTISDIVRPYYIEKTEDNKESGNGNALENKPDTCESLDTEEKTQRKKKKKKKKVPKLEKDNEEERNDHSDEQNAQMQESTQDTSQPEEMKKKKKKKKKKKVVVEQLNGD